MLQVDIILKDFSIDVKNLLTYFRYFNVLPSICVTLISLSPRYHYYVKFADLGMDWILAPEGYDAYYCSGDCPFMYLAEQKSSLYYTFVIARANYNNPMASPRPCCTPASLSDLSIMFSSGKLDSMVSTPDYLP